MGTSADFTSYVVARWPALVRTLVLLGHDPAEADAIVVESLSRCVSSFDRLAREGDVDVAVHRTLLDTRLGTRADRTRLHADREPVVVGAVTVPDLERLQARLRDLEADLARLDGQERVATVLGLAAELDELQVADVLGADVRPAFTDGHDALEAIPVRTAPVDEVLARWRERRRRRTRLTAAGLAAALVLVAAATWWGTRPPVDELPPPEVTEEANPAAIAWYANRELHLAEVVVELPQLTSLVEVPDGAVVADTEGRVLVVDQRGRVTRVGLTDAGGTVVGGGDERGLVAWLDVDGATPPELVVHDTVRGREQARRPVPDGAQVVALDGDEVFYNVDGRSWSWSYGTPVEPGTEPGGLLVDIASRVRATQFSAASVLVSQPLFDIQVTVPGRDAVLSPDGDYLLARVDYGVPDELRIYLAANGAQLPSGVRRGEVALAASFGDDHTVTYVVARREHMPEGGDFVRLSEAGPHLLRTCDLDLGTCETVTQFTNSRGQPVLPS